MSETGATLITRSAPLTAAWVHSILDRAVEDTPQAFAQIKTALVSGQGQTYRDFRRELTPVPWIVWRDIIIGYAGLLAVVAVALVLEATYPVASYVATIPVAVLLGFALHHLGMFQHAAAHFGIAQDRGTNDALANVLFGVLFASHIKAYRAQHGAHHLNHGGEGDSENAYIEKLDAVFFLNWLSGRRTLQKLLGIGRATPTVSPEWAETAKKYGWFRLSSLLIHVAICIVLFWAGFIAVAIAWGLAIGVFFPMISDVRLIVEHRRPDADPGANYAVERHGAYTRMFKGGLFSKVIGSAGFDRHMLHHWEPSVPYERLPDLERYLRSAGLGEILDGRTTTYSVAFGQLIRIGTSARSASHSAR